MAKSKQQKHDVVNEMVQELKSSKSAIFANYFGLSVSDATELRNTCREQNIGCFVIKKTLLKRGLKEAGYEDASQVDSFSNGVMMLLGRDDEVAPARIVKDFGKSHASFTFYGGILTSEEVQERFLTADGAMQLAELPSKQELQAKLVGSLNAPISGFVNALSGNLRGLVTALKAIQDQKAN